MLFRSAAVAIDLSTALGHAFVGFWGSSGPNRVTVLALLAPLLRTHRTRVHIGRGRAGGAVGGRGVGSLGAFSGSVNANGPGLNTDAAALGTCQMRPTSTAKFPVWLSGAWLLLSLRLRCWKGKCPQGGTNRPTNGFACGLRASVCFGTASASLGPS